MRDYAVEIMAEVGAPAGSATVEREGRSFTATFFPGTKNTPSAIRFTTPVDEAPEGAHGGAYRDDGRAHVAVRPALILRPETRLDRFGKRIGVNREIQTGDAAFDAGVYVESDAPDEDLRRTLADERLRRAVGALVDGGAGRVELDPSGLSVRHTMTKGAPAAAEIERRLSLLGRAAAALPLFTAGRAEKATSGGLFEVMTAIALASVGALLLILVAGRTPIRPAGLVLSGLALGLVLWALVALALARLLRGGSRALRRVIGYGFATLMFVPSATITALLRVNHDLDDSPAVNRVTPVSRAYDTAYKGTTYHRVEVASWQPGEANLTFDVPAAFAYSARTVKTIVVVTRAGKLGGEWVEGFRLAR